MLKLNIKERKPSEKPEAVRAAGNLPGVFYGPKEKSTAIVFSSVEFKKVWRAAGESTVIALEGVGEEKQALIHEVDLDPVKGTARHIDFYVIEKGKKLKVKVPVEFSGIAPAVKDLGGSLVKVLHEIEIEAMPKDLPKSLHADISLLKDFSSKIHIKDIKMPEGVVCQLSPEEVVAVAAAPRVEEEKVEEPVDLSAIEVEKKGKEAKEGEVPADGAAPAKEEKKEAKK